MDEYTDLEKFTDTELIRWLRKRSLYGFNNTLAKRLIRLHEIYWRQRQEIDVLKKRVAKCL